MPIDGATGSPQRRSAAVVHNPTKVDFEDVRASVARAERLTGRAPTLWFETGEDDVGQGVGRAALEAGADLIVTVRVARL